MSENYRWCATRPMEAAQHIDELNAQLAEATELVREALRYPHKPGSKHSTWDDRAMKFISASDSAEPRETVTP